MRRQVLNAAEAGDGDTTVNWLRQRIAAEPYNVEPRLQLAWHYARQGFSELELEHARVAVERFPASVEARVALAQALRRGGQPRAAAEALEALLASRPESQAEVEALNLLGIAWDEAGEWRAGERAFRRALALAPEPDLLHNNLGYNLLEQRRVAEAIPEFEKALRRNPRSATARNNLGVALARSPAGGVAEALKHFETVTDAATANSNLAAVLIEQGRYQQSRELLAAALDYNRAHQPALANLRLAGELDGGPAVVRPPKRRSLLARSFAALKKVF